MFSANCNIDGVRRSMVGVVLLVLGRGGGGGVCGGGGLCRKPLPEDVCFNADNVPVEAVMLI